MSDRLFYPNELSGYSNKQCFLCGQVFDETNKERRKTDEHIFPGWLQNKYNLWNERFTLRNGTSIPFHQLTVFCCSSCNQTLNEKIETPMREGVKGGYAAFMKLDRHVLWLWMAKIMYGMLRRELSLPIDRRDQSKGSITTPEILKAFANIHDFLQSARVPVDFDFQPGSTFVFEIFTEGSGDRFTYHNAYNQNGTTILALRMNNIGVIACMEDYGTLQRFFDDRFIELDALKLHPVQFDELCAVVTYKASIINQIPYLIHFIPEDGKMKISLVAPSEREYPRQYAFAPWDETEYRQFLLHYWRHYVPFLRHVFQSKEVPQSAIFDAADNVLILHPDQRKMP